MKKLICSAAAVFSLALAAQVPDLPLLKIFHLAGRQKPAENLLLSPWGIQECFGIISGGADRECAAELSKFLGLNKDSSEKICQARTSLQQSKTDFKSYNAVFIEQRQKAKKTFVRHAVKLYKSDLYSVNFSEKEKCAKILNSIVRRGTSGMFDNVFTPRSFTPAPALLLLNTLYFNSEWKDPFRKRDTEREQFTISSPDGKTASRRITVDMMNATFRVPYYTDKELHGIILSYRDRRFKLLALMPLASTTPLSRATAVLAEKGIQHFISESSSFRETQIKLPKLKLSGETDLKELLFSVGMKNLFSPEKGGLSEMTEDKPLFVSAAKQLVKLDLDEEKTKVAAVTYTIAKSSAPAPEPEPPQYNYFYADRPFVLILFDSETNAILLTAAVVNPR